MFEGYDHEYYDSYADDLYASITSSMNDMPIKSMIKQLKSGIENESIYEKQHLVDSLVLGTRQYDAVKNDFLDLLGMRESTPTTNNYPLPPKEQPHHLFEEEDWGFSKGKWQPPDNPTIAHVRTLQSKLSPSQSDSGANRVVTDDINLLLDAHAINPTPMSGCGCIALPRKRC